MDELLMNSLSTTAGCVESRTNNLKEIDSIIVDSKWPLDVLQFLV